MMYENKNWLYNMYIVLEKSLREIGELCGVGITTIYTWMKKHNIPRRTPVEAVDIIWKDKKYRDKEWLHNQYIIFKKSTNQIEKEFGYASTSIYKWLKKFDIPIRSKSEALTGNKLSPEHRLKAIAVAVPFPKGEAHPNWIGGFMTEQICEVCGITFPVRKDFVARGEGRFCSFECRSKGLSGENSPVWKGGPGAVYPKEFNNTLKQQVRKRDNYICQMLNCDNTGENTALAVHHIDYDKNNNEMENLVSLCHSCHSKTNFNREKWIEYFKELFRGKIE